ncbi:MAG: NAD(P)/FAD-dependent oxidoreductase [Eubacteriales bacterium]|nr:NAD(P)/FAD-dependent oxidoreductase [Eubacteriales bacterium]
MKKIVVVGAGASGLMAAITAARCGAQVTLLEGMEKPGKKLLVTGNGKCNLTNLKQECADFYRGATTAFIQTVLRQFTVADTMQFFEELGLLLTERNGYVYPNVGQALAVVEILLMECARRHVRIKNREKVTELRYERGHWYIQTEGWHYEADAVILAAGSKAAPKTGSDGSGYQLAKSLGHHVISPWEALTPLKASDACVKRLAGLRMPIQLTLHIHAENTDAGSADAIYHESGEVQWTDYGISGIVVFQLSRYAVQALQHGQTVTASLDLLPTLSVESLRHILTTRPADGTLLQYLTGLLPAKMIPVLLERCRLRAEQKASVLTDAEQEALLHEIKHFGLTIVGCKGYDMAQVCAGGVDTCEISADSLESLLHPGLYFSGELLDVDGICGGYNLQWAWSSGYTAGFHAAG